MAIEVVNRQRLCAIDPGRVGRVAAAALRSVDQQGCSLTVAFVRDRAIRDLNSRYRNKDRATDVLSFPSTGDVAIEGDSTQSGRFIGDIIISTDTALRQAAESGVAFEHEVDELVLHGVLHLCGYDHETDQGEMNRLEMRLRRKILDERQEQKR